MTKIQFSVIIPTYNEEKYIQGCLESILEQSEADKLEILVIDDASEDATVSKVNEIKNLLQSKQIKLFFKNKHEGPGISRNFGANKAIGEILIFVDADMIFDRNFLKNLVKPIQQDKTIGTDSQEEYLANPENLWAKCWNIGRFAAAGFARVPNNRSIIPRKDKHSTIFRAIEKSVFSSVGGFDTDGDYTDDESLYKKLRKESAITKAKFYHYDPDSFFEVRKRALWIGSGKNFTGSINKKIKNLVKFSPPMSLAKGLLISIYYFFFPFIVFKLIYDFSVWTAIIKSFKRSRRIL